MTLMKEIFQKDPTTYEIANKGIARVNVPKTKEELDTLRYELQTFVCEGEYERGLDRILSSYLNNIDKSVQSAFWVSGFFGSGKSHLVKMLKYLWSDYKFPDGATARGLVNLPESIRALLVELSTRGKQEGGLHSAAGTLGSGASDIRLTLLGVVFMSAGLPEEYHLARFILWLKQNNLYENVVKYVEAEGVNFYEEIFDLYASPFISRAILKAYPEFAKNEADVRLLLLKQFPEKEEVTINQMVDAIHDTLAKDHKFPCTLIVLDEVQQFIGDDTKRAMDVQEVTEACSNKFGSKLLFVGTGQSALTGTPQLQKIKARFSNPIELADTDVEKVTRKMILAKKESEKPEIKKLIAKYNGEISRQLKGTKIERRREDDDTLVTDYPILPVRRRFWEQTLRAIDRAGTEGQLRSQIKIIHEAIKQYSDKPITAIIPADFLYDQLYPSMLETGVLPRDLYDIIKRQDDGTPDGKLRSRLCATIFLIDRLPKDQGASIGIHSTPSVLADLLIDDLEKKTSDLRNKIPEVLDELVQKSDLIKIDEEYHLQTRESAAWDAEFRDRYYRIFNDISRINNDRSDILRNKCLDTIKDAKILQGKCKVPRKIVPYFDIDRPNIDLISIPVWIRDGWNIDEKTFLNDVRSEDPKSPMIFVLLPKRSSDELKKLLAAIHAADETLKSKGSPTIPEGIEAKSAMQTRLDSYTATIDLILREIINGARIFQAGGDEVSGSDFYDAIIEASGKSLIRLYDKFDEGDDPKWSKVIERAQKGDANPLTVVGYTGKIENNYVCKSILEFVARAAGRRKGSDILKEFGKAPYGWPLDTINGALFALLSSRHITAFKNGVEVDAKTLDMKTGVADFKVENAPPSTPQRIEVRKLYAMIGIPFTPNEESRQVIEFINKLKILAAEAGGDSPLPQRPDVSYLDELTNLSSNDQVKKLSELSPTLISNITDWQNIKQAIDKRIPLWNKLQRMLYHGKKLSIYTEVYSQAKAIEDNRSLLDEPNPIEHLCDKLADALRYELSKYHNESEEIYNKKMEELENSEPWKELKEPQKSEIMQKNNLQPIPKIDTSSDEEIIECLNNQPLEWWNTLKDALPKRFGDALSSAIDIISKGKIQVVDVEPRLLKDENDLDSWLGSLRQKMLPYFKNGKQIQIK